MTKPGTTSIGFELQFLLANDSHGTDRQGEAESHARVELVEFLGVDPSPVTETGVFPRAVIKSGSFSQPDA